MDITINIDNYKLNVRAAGIIIHNNKVLLHKNINEDHYALVGGRVEIGEDSAKTVKREILEEIGKKVEITGYVSTIENFFQMKDTKYHEILFVHKAEFINEEDKKIAETLKNVEGRKELQYEWIDLDKIDEVNVLPLAIRPILKEKNFPIHKINNEIE